jgi:hypothetical protein
MRMIKCKSPIDGQWKRHDRSKPQSRPKATFIIVMAKYKEGSAGIRGQQTRPSGIPNRTVRFP